MKTLIDRNVKVDKNCIFAFIHNIKTDLFKIVDISHYTDYQGAKLYNVYYRNKNYNIEIYENFKKVEFNAN